MILVSGYKVVRGAMMTYFHVTSAKPIGEDDVPTGKIEVEMPWGNGIEVTGDFMDKFPNSEPFSEMCKIANGATPIMKRAIVNVK